MNKYGINNLDIVSQSFTKGTVIWYPSCIVSGGTKILVKSIKWHNLDNQDGYFCKVRLPGNLMLEPQIVEIDSEDKGLICKVHHIPSNDYNYLVVDKVAKDGKFITAIPGGFIKNFIEFQKQCFSSICETYNKSVEEKYKNWVNKLSNINLDSPNHHRLFINRTHDWETEQRQSYIYAERF